MVIQGMRSREQVLGQAAHTCPRCRSGSYFSLVRVRRARTVLHVPFLPLADALLGRCNRCGYSLALDDTEFAGLLHASTFAWAGDVPPAR